MGAAVSSLPAPPPDVPILRDDLDLQPTTSDDDGAPAFLLHDPLAGRFHRLGADEVDLLGLVGAGDAATIARLSHDLAGEPFSKDDVSTFLAYLRRNHLVLSDGRQRLIFLRHHASRPGWLAKLVKSYLSVRIPLVRPDLFLTRTLPHVRWLAAPLTLWIIALMGVCGLFLASRQFDIFLNTFADFLNWQGALAMAVTLGLVKVLHEFGHAYTAKAFGLRVPTMGVALIVFWPVLYTDTSDAWRLTDRRRRLLVAGAGMMVELAVAGLALLLWNLAPDGLPRGLLFLLASSTWILSLLVNLNPLMRFDGYFLLSDLWGVHNLEARSHALGRWRLRQALFGSAEPPPEPPQLRLILYAYAIWIYRLGLYLGIAALVYHLAFKVLGIVLFAIEVSYFVALPIAREVLVWVRHKETVRVTWQSLRTLAVLVTLVGLAVLPWHGTIVAPAMLEARSVQVFTPAEGRLASLLVTADQAVTEGQTLAVIQAPDLEHELSQARLRLAELQGQSRVLGYDAALLSQSLTVTADIEAQAKLVRSLEAGQHQLTVTAPLTGTVVDLAAELQAGQWLGKGERLLSVIDRTTAVISAYLSETDVARVAVGARARLYPQGGAWPELEAEVVGIDPVALATLDATALASTVGGEVEVHRGDSDDDLLPVQATYKLRLRLLSASPPIFHALRLSAVIEAHPLSLAGAAYRRLLSILYRESGF